MLTNASSLPKEVLNTQNNVLGSCNLVDLLYRIYKSAQRTCRDEIRKANSAADIRYKEVAQYSLETVEFETKCLRESLSGDLPGLGATPEKIISEIIRLSLFDYFKEEKDGKNTKTAEQLDTKLLMKEIEGVFQSFDSLHNSNKQENI